MGARELSEQAFPILPEYKASWRPLYWEPIHGSGERITFAILVRSSEGVRIHSVLRPAAIRALYGKKAAGVRGFFQLVADDLHAYLERGESPNSWKPPIHGIHIGNWRNSVSDSLHGVLAQAVSQVASLSWPDSFPMYDDRGEDTQQEPIRKRLLDQVKDYVAAQRQELLPYFEREGKLVENGVPVRFGFVSQSLVAHFGLLRPGDIGRSYKDARGRLWELQKAHQRAQFRHASLILQIPRQDDILFDDLQLDHAQTAFEELRLEAMEEKVEVVPVHTAIEAGAQLLLLAA